jgi:hypothetical protein
MLAEYSLFALRCIFDAYGEKGERISRRLRRNKFVNLRSKILVVNNPDALILKKKKVKPVYSDTTGYLSADIQREEEPSVHMDGFAEGDCIEPGEYQLKDEAKEIKQEIARRKLNKWGLLEGNYPSDLDSIDLADGSVHSHRTPTILDEHEVSFENRQGMLPQEPSSSEESFDE